MRMTFIFAISLFFSAMLPSSARAQSDSEIRALSENCIKDDYDCADLEKWAARNSSKFRKFEKQCRSSRNRKSRSCRIYGSIIYARITSGFGHDYTSNQMRNLDNLCKDGLKNACLTLGYGYNFKDQDNAALRAFVRGCDLGNTDACASAGDKYEDLGDDRNFAVYHGKACDLGDSAFCRNAIYGFTHFVSDPANAEKYSKTYCALDVKACQVTAVMELNRYGYLSKPDAEKLLDTLLGSSSRLRKSTLRDQNSINEHAFPKVISKHACLAGKNGTICSVANRANK